MCKFRLKTLEDLGVERVNDYSMGGVPRPTGPPGSSTLPVNSNMRSTTPGINPFLIVKLRPVKHFYLLKKQVSPHRKHQLTTIMAAIVVAQHLEKWPGNLIQHLLQNLLQPQHQSTVNSLLVLHCLILMLRIQLNCLLKKETQSFSKPK